MLMSIRAAIVILAVAASNAARLTGSSAYEVFRRQFKSTTIRGDTTSYHARVAMWERRREEVDRHNAQAGKLWVATVNKFSDYTKAEFKVLLGYRSKGFRAAESSSLAALQPSQELAQAVDWSTKLNASTQAKNQGGCGSCWAVATAGALETHAEIAGARGLEVSYEQLVDCVENPNECGGTGGCEGATSELAFEWTKKHGIVARADYKGYESSDSGEGKCVQDKSPVLTTQGFMRLPENQGAPLMEALSTKGPVVVSADASPWGAYSSGIFDGCREDALINHAILAMGYGTDAELKTDYWLIRNSWGKDWGDHGYIRLLKHSDDSFCGTDIQPLEGVGCKGGPAKLKVCGMCGILSDSAYPTGVQLAAAAA